MKRQSGAGRPAVLAVAIGDPLRAAEWRDAFAAAAPDLAVLPAEEAADPAAVDFLLLWRAPPGTAARFPQLKAVLSLGAGVDAILADPSIPAGLPVIRMVDEALTQGMSEYVLWQVLRYHRREPELAAAQRGRRWTPVAAPLAGERCVGIMGMGELGGAAARRLAGCGFRVKGWGRSAREVAGVATFHGAAQLDAFLAGVEILVCLLPLTPETAGILSARLFAALPRGAVLVNAARGEHLVEGDLLAALAAGRIAGATLDAFRAEPLPPDHPFWSHPAITVTPHIASLTRPASGARSLVAEMRRILAGDAPLHAARRDRGY